MPVGENGMAFQRLRGAPTLRKVCLPLHSCRLIRWKEKSRHHYNSRIREFISISHLIFSSAPSLLFPFLSFLFLSFPFLSVRVRDTFFFFYCYYQRFCVYWLLGHILQVQMTWMISIHFLALFTSAEWKAIKNSDQLFFHQPLWMIIIPKSKSQCTSQIGVIYVGNLHFTRM